MLMPVGVADEVEDVAEAGVREADVAAARATPGLSTGSADAARARSRSCSIGGRGRAASMRSRIVCSSAATLAAACGCSGRTRRPAGTRRSAASSWSLCSNSRAARDARATRPPSRAPARSCSSGCRDRPGRPAGTRRPLRPDCRRAAPFALAERLAGGACQPDGPAATETNRAQALSQSSRHVSLRPAQPDRLPPAAVEYAISIDSAPIRRMRYRPSMISPSRP